MQGQVPYETWFTEKIFPDPLEASPQSTGRCRHVSANLFRDVLYVWPVGRKIVDSSCNTAVLNCFGRSQSFFVFVIFFFLAVTSWAAQRLGRSGPTAAAQVLRVEGKLPSRILEASIRQCDSIYYPQFREPACFQFSASGSRMPSTIGRQPN